jgi:hypothetical protein
MIDFNTLEEYRLPDVDSDGYVYFLFYKEILVYIGITTSFHSRVAAHKTTKVFDKVLYEICSVENLKIREKELIKYYNPILNGEYGCTPKNEYMVIGDYLFSNEYKKVMKITGYEVHDKDGLFGFIRGDIFCYYSFTSHYRYSFQSNSTQKHNFPNSDRIKDADVFDYFYFDKTDFCFKEKERLKKKIVVNKEYEFNKQQGATYATKQLQKIYDKAVLVEVPSLKDSYEFKFGKYNGMLVSEIKKINKNYITWFEENVPIERW